MGSFLQRARVNHFWKASFFLFFLFNLTVREVAESLRVSGSTPLLLSETQGSFRHSLFGNKLNADIQNGASARRQDFALGPGLPSAFLLVNPVVSREGDGHLKKTPVLTVVDLGLFEVINPLSENATKVLDLSWLAHVVLAKEETDSSSVTEPPHSGGGPDRNPGNTQTTEGGGGVADRGAAPPEHDNTMGRPISGGLSPTQPQENPTGRNMGMDDLDPRRRAEQGGKAPSPSGGSLADAIEATGDKDLIEEAGLGADNPWKLVDEADAMERERKEGMADRRRRDRMPRPGMREGSGDGGGAPPDEERSKVSPKVPKEKGGSEKEKAAGGVFVGKTVRVDATYVFEGSAGPLNVQYATDAPKLCRTVLVENTSSGPLRVFARTTDAAFEPENVYTPSQSRPGAPSSASSFLENSAHFLKRIFLQVSSRLTTPPDSEGRAEAETPSLTSVDELMEQLRQSREDRPGKPSELLINLAEGSPTQDNNTPGPLYTERGARAVEALRQLMEKTFSQRKQAVQVMRTLQMIIVSFPYGVEFEARIRDVLESILHSCDGLITRWSFAGEVTVTSRAFDNSPSAPDSADTSKPPQNSGAEENALFEGTLPDDPELQRKLYGMFMTNISSAWLHGENGKGVVVAVLDTGVSAHAELNCNFWSNSKETADGTDTDGNGLPDDLRGFNFDEERGDPEDQNGHGTHIAGIISACANGEGIVGGSFGAKLISLRFMDKDGSGAVANGIRGVAYAIQEKVHVLNNSWGGPDGDPQLEWVLSLTARAHGGKGMLIVNAAGNESVDNDVTPSYPANWKTENSLSDGLDIGSSCVRSLLFSVAAVDIHGNLAEFSNWGRRTVDIAAPGVTIYSTAPDGKFQFMSGTSMATPHVSAVAALIYGAFFKNGYHPPASEVKDIIRLTVKKIPNLEDLVAWGGVPNAKDAILVARMGGMWVQSACEDMIVDVPPGAGRVIKIFFNGYRPGLYRAKLTLDVFDEQQSRVDKIQIPFKLISSRQPAPNTHTDAESTQGFPTVSNLGLSSEREGLEDLCRLQVKFLNLDGGLPLWTIILLVAAGTITLLAGVIGCIIWQRRRQRRDGYCSSEEEATFLRDNSAKRAGGGAATKVGIIKSLSRKGGPVRRAEPEIESVPPELHSREDAYR